jgi:hypothetical protein
LRSLSNIDVDRVFMVGGLPNWVEESKVVHIPTVQDAGKFVNIGRNLQAVLEAETSDPFLAMNDDQFIMSPWVPEIHTRFRTMDDFVNSLRYVGNTDHDSYVRGMRSQRDIMKEWGFDTSTVRCSDSHWPMPVHPERCREILARAAEVPGHELGHFKAIYATGLDLVEGRDCKIQTPAQELPDWPVVSTSAGAWTGRAGRRIREVFDESSIYER